jgi:hypothetical protein
MKKAQFNTTQKPFCPPAVREKAFFGAISASALEYLRSPYHWPLPAMARATTPHALPSLVLMPKITVFSPAIQPAGASY